MVSDQRVPPTWVNRTSDAWSAGSAMLLVALGAHVALADPAMPGLPRWVDDDSLIVRAVEVRRAPDRSSEERRQATHTVFGTILNDNPGDVCLPRVVVEARDPTGAVVVRAIGYPALARVASGSEASFLVPIRVPSALGSALVTAQRLEGCHPSGG